MDQALLSLIKNPVLDYTPVTRVSTGSLSFDLACGVNDGVGGLPVGLFTEMWGDTGTGKSTLALVAAAAASKVGNVIYYDVERKLNHEWAAHFGARLGENFVLAQPDDGAQCLNEIINLLDHNDDLGISLIILDSIGALNTGGIQYTDKAKHERADFRDTPMARLARLLTPFFEQARPTLAQSGAAFLMINHVRANIGGYGGSQYAPGGYAKDLATSLEVRTLAANNIERTSNRVKTVMGRYLNGETKKNQTAFHPRTLKVPILFEPRVIVDTSLETLEAGIEAGILVDEDGRRPDGQKMIYFGEVELGGGKFRAAGALDKQSDLREEIRRHILAPKVNALMEAT